MRDRQSQDHRCDNNHEEVRICTLRIQLEVCSFVTMPELPRDLGNEEILFWNLFHAPLMLRFSFAGRTWEELEKMEGGQDDRRVSSCDYQHAASSPD